MGAAGPADACGQFLALGVVAAAVAAAGMLPPPPAHADAYSGHGFYIEHPGSWTVHDLWPSSGSVSFRAGAGAGGGHGQGAAAITVSLQSGYEVVTQDGRPGALPAGLAGQALLDELVRSSKDACQYNVHGPCWYYELDDSKLIVIGGTQAASLRYSATVDDREITVREIVLPAGDGAYWVARGTAGDGGPVGDMESILGTFSAPRGGGAAAPAEDRGGGASAAAGGGGTAPTAGGSCGEDPLKATNIIPADPSIMLEKALDVNLVLVGGEWSDHDISVLRRELPSYCDPVVTATGKKVGIRYLYDYDFVSRPDASGLADTMDRNSAKRPLFEAGGAEANTWLGWWVWEFHRDWITDGFAGGPPGEPEYRLVDALAVEEYLYESVIASDPELADPASANLVFLRPDPRDIGYLYNYHLDGFDKSTGKRFEFVGLMGYGGTHNMQFFDLHSVPWIDIDIVTFKYDEWGHLHTLHDCDRVSGEACFYDAVSSHTRSALNHIVTPSFLYPVEYHERYLVDILVYVAPGGTVTVTPASLKSLVDRGEILAELEYLYPHAEWSLEMSVERRDRRGLSLDFKRELEQGASGWIEESAFGPGREFRILDSGDLQPHLLDWARDRIAERGAGGGTRVIPVLVVVGTTDAELSIDRIGAIGLAPPILGDDSEPCCALGVTDESDMWEEGIGLSDLILHEVGHVLGLHHTFVSFDTYGASHYNGYYNWYASPMTYSLPSSSTACGFLYGIVYDRPCGNPSASYTVFERDRLADARLASLYKKVDEGILGLGSGRAGPARMLAAESIEMFGRGDILSARGALPKMAEAHAAVLEAGEPSAGPAPEARPPAAAAPHAAVPPRQQPPPAALPNDPAPRVPGWVKSSAGWWADGMIPDSDFVSGIEFLIGAGVIRIDAAPDGSSGQAQPRPGSDPGQSIPGWVKTSAGWWAGDMISDAEFVSGMEFLVSKGVIRVGR